jgi:putative salt-induced outer membrane protein YdiY
VEVSGGGANVAVAPAEITAIRDADEQHDYERMLAPRLLDLWAGNASLGLAGATGNARTSTFTVGVVAARATHTDKTTLSFGVIKSSALAGGKNQQTANAVRGGVAYDHNAGSRLFVNVFNDYEFDRFQNLDLRFVLGGGAGFHAMKKERTRLDLLGGIDFNRSSYSTPLITKSAEFYWGDEFSYKLSGATSLAQTFRMFNDLSHTGDYRMNGDIGVSTKVAKWLTWNLALSDRYLSHPAPGRKTNDFLYTTGLGISFAR